MRSTSTLAAAVLLALLAPLLGAEEETARARLEQARRLLNILKDHEQACAVYESVANLESLEPDDRADALIGAAVCHMKANRHNRAIAFLDQIIAGEATLRREAVDWARSEKSRLVGPGNGGDHGGSLQHLKEEQQRRAREKVSEAREMLAARRYEHARNLCFEALSLDYENEEARALLGKIESSRPDRGGLITHLSQFLQTAQLEEYQRLLERVTRLLQDGKRAFDEKDYRTADGLFREAILLIDRSDFLSTGGALNLDPLGELRARLLTFLREAHDRGGKEGLSFPPEPAMPDVAERKGGLQREFYSLLARILSPPEPGREPLRFYDFAPGAPKDPDAKPLLGQQFFDGLHVSHRTGTLSRSRWAERWIRRHIGARWRDPALPGARARTGTDGSGLRILTRFGSMICAQHREAEHARIQRLRDAFESAPPALRVDVRLFAAGSGGAVRAANSLGASASGDESGRDVVISSHLIEACAELLTGKEGLVQLGSATLRLFGQTSVALDITSPTALHPQYESLTPPSLLLPDRDARYGLTVELYAEYMSNRLGNARSALSVRTLVRQPDSRLGSHVVPKPYGPEQYSRLPVFTEQVCEADRELPHFGTFMMFGLVNPFPATCEKYPELLLLVGIRRQDTPTPDPPRIKPGPRIEPADLQEREYPLGQLARDVEDQVVPEGWPDRRSVADGPSAAARRRLRNAALAEIVAELAHLDPTGGEEAHGVVVQDGRATANVSEEEHARIAEAATHLRGHEADHYVVSVQTAAVDAARWKAWTEVDGVVLHESGALVAGGSALGTIERELAPLAGREGLFNSRRRQIFTRATQQVAHLAIRTRAITKDLRTHTVGDTTLYAPVQGAAEDGLAVEVRPFLEEPDGKGRRVMVRARAARLLQIEPRAYPQSQTPAAMYEVPRWHKTPKGAATLRVFDDVLDDSRAALLPLDFPGESDKLIVVLIAVTKVP